MLSQMDTQNSKFLLNRAPADRGEGVGAAAAVWPAAAGHVQPARAADRAGRDGARQGGPRQAVHHIQLPTQGRNSMDIIFGGLSCPTLLQRL